VRFEYRDRKGDDAHEMIAVHTTEELQAMINGIGKSKGRGKTLGERMLADAHEQT